MRRIFTIGETVFDILFINDQPVSAKAGGAMLNTSVSLGRLGLPVSFITEIGRDKPGKNIIEFLRQNYVDTQSVYQFKEGKTALALAFLDENENADYSFYKLYPAKRLTVDLPEVNKDDIVLFGSFFAITQEVREPLLTFIRNARKAGAIVIYDPNFRKPHLDDLSRVMEMIIENISLSTIVRGSDEDFKLIFGSNNADETYRLIKAKGSSLLLVTAGDKNTELRSQHINMSFPVPKIHPVSTVGAGDSFNAGLIYSIYTENISASRIGDQNQEFWENAVKTAISCGSHVCQHYENYITEVFAGWITSHSHSERN